MIDEIFDAKEKLLIEFMLSDRVLFTKCSTIVQPEYFEKPLDSVVRFVQKFYYKHHNIPSMVIIHAETGVTLDEHELEDAELEYLSGEIERHCKENAMRIAILEGADMLSEADETEVDFGAIQNAVKRALMISIDKDLGTDLFADPEARLLAMQAHIDAASCGWVGVDLIIDKCKRSEMVIFAGNSGSGKSVILANIASNMAKDGKNALVISLELGEDLVTKRMDSIVTEVETKEVFNSISDIVEILAEKEKTYGSIHVKRMPLGTNANAIRAYLMEYEIKHGYKPDVICLDYLDLLATNERVDGNIFDKDKVKSEELREIFEDYNAYGFTASQLNRDAIDTEHKSQAHIAGGLSKINTADVAFAITRDEEQQDNGELHLSLMKLRNAEFSNEVIVLMWNDKNLRITDSTTQQKKSGGRALASSASGKNEKSSERLNKLMKKSKK